MFWTFWFWKIVQKRWWYWYYCIGKMMGLLFQIYSHSQWKWIKMHLSPWCRPAVTLPPPSHCLSSHLHSWDWADTHIGHGAGIHVFNTFCENLQSLAMSNICSRNVYLHIQCIYSNEISWKELVKMQKDEGMSLRTDNKMGESPLHCWR